MNGLSHKFDESHICTACGHSAGWVDKWKSFECKPEIASCPYCQKLIDIPVERKIICISWNTQKRKKYVDERVMEFCSEECGLHYQMGCEG